MKSILIIAVAALTFGECMAQKTEVIYSEEKEPREVQTLMKSASGFGGHFSMNIKGTQVYDETAIMVGGELVFTLNHALNIGVARYGMPTRIDYEDINDFTERIYRLSLDMEAFVLDLKEDLNTVDYPLIGWAEGMYFLKFSYRNQEEVFRLVVAR
jgi:hypothetical protein